jgi:hypothetical protein
MPSSVVQRVLREFTPEQAAAFASNLEKYVEDSLRLLEAWKPSLYTSTWEYYQYQVRPACVCLCVVMVVVAGGCVGVCGLGGVVGWGGGVVGWGGGGVGARTCLCALSLCGAVCLYTSRVCFFCTQTGTRPAPSAQCMIAFPQRCLPQGSGENMGRTSAVCGLGMWGCLAFCLACQEDVVELLASLDQRGVREAALFETLTEYLPQLLAAMPERPAPLHAPSEDGAADADVDAAAGEEDDDDAAKRKKSREVCACCYVLLCVVVCSHSVPVAPCECTIASHKPWDCGV